MTGSPAVPVVSGDEGPSGGVANSVELAEGSMGAAETSITIDLAQGQDWSKCVPFLTLVYDGNAFDDAMDHSCFSCEVFDNSGTAAVRVQRGAGLTNFSVSVYVYVVEFSADIGVQKLSFSSSGASWTAACTAVNLDHAFVIASARNDTNDDDNHARHVQVGFNSTTEVGFARYAATGTFTGFAYVVEDLTAGDHFSVQAVDATYASATNNDETIEAVDIGATMLLTTHRANSSTGATNSSYLRPTLVNNTTLRITTITGVTVGVTTFVVTWADGTVVQSGVEEFASPATGTGVENRDITIGSVDPTKSIALPAKQDIGMRLSADVDASSSIEEWASAFFLTSPTNLRVSWKNDPIALDHDVVWQVVSFA